MYIVDKNKDYYDYLSHIYGIDKKVVFDRRGSVQLTDETLFKMISYEWERSLLHLKYERKKRFFLLLEIGDVQYIIEVIDMKTKKDQCNVNQFQSCSFEIVHTFNNHEHHYDSIISIRKIDIAYRWKKDHSKYYGFTREYVMDNNFNETVAKFDEHSVIDLPILADTQLTSLIDGNELWIGLQNYISSLNNDEDSGTEMTDVEKAEVHGFDKKTSFRNPIR